MHIFLKLSNTVFWIRIRFISASWIWIRFMKQIRIRSIIFLIKKKMLKKGLLVGVGSGSVIQGNGSGSVSKLNGSATLHCLNTYLYIPEIVRYEHLVAGMSGGVISTLILHPLDLLKIRYKNCHIFFY